ncbi:hypothetical protein QFC19_004759 [Naganishia cerealis]|uniref:Uncharacterized protein n=1 Tax=Naganishia cerealis TaxID=610337 RepID=A0ACC2VU77_9TREE|nr:hypothetical protein QFC19_004759 [Naganishia cerealis]
MAASTSELTGHPNPSRCSRSPSPSAKRIKLSNTKSDMSTTATDNDSLALGSLHEESLQTPMPDSTTSAKSYAAPSPSMQAAVEEEMGKTIEVAKTYEKELDYENKLVLAPMVRTGSLPMRLLSLHYGAGLVWGPEIVDKAIIGAERIVDLIYQIGTSDPELAVQAAKTVEQDVAGFDLNCGCPKPFSNGRSTALHPGPAPLHSTGIAQQRLCPRIMQNPPLAGSTIDAASRLTNSSVKALWERLGDIVQLGKRRGVPVLCNGDGEGWANWKTIREMTGATSVMIARAAESNPSIFNPTGPISTMETLIPSTFLPVCVFIANHYSNTKFLLYQFKPSPAPISSLTKAERKKFSDGIAAAKTIDQAVQFFGLTMDGARTVGEQFMKDLKKTLKEREPDAYGADDYGDDWVKAALAAAPPTTLAAPTQPLLAVPAHPVDHHTKDIFEQRKDAESMGKVQDMPTTIGSSETELRNGVSEVLKQEELDEEAMLNA